MMGNKRVQRAGELRSAELGLFPDGILTVEWSLPGRTPRISLGKVMFGSCLDESRENPVWGHRRAVAKALWGHFLPKWEE